MPAGRVPEEILSAKGLVVAIDTNVIEGAGFKLLHGPLHLLRYQLPKGIRIVLSEVVVRECIDHQMSKILKTHKDVQGSIRHLSRTAFVNADGVHGALHALSIPASAPHMFRQRLLEYVESFGGQFVGLEGESLTETVLSRYFKYQAPFGNLEARKSEFPDAYALLTLEAYAIQSGVTVVAVSGDDEWGSFAKKSKALYRVKTLDDLAALFTVAHPRKEELSAKLNALLENQHSRLNKSIHQEFGKGFSETSWQPFGSPDSAQVEAVRIENVELRFHSDRLWTMTGDVEKALLEVRLNVDAVFSIIAEVSGFEMDSSGEYVTNIEKIGIPQRVVIPATIELQGDLFDGGEDTWSMTIDIPREIKVNLGNLGNIAEHTGENLT